MALARPFESIVLLDFVHLPRHASSIPAAANPLPASNLSRRDVMLICTVPLNLVALSPASLARERRARNSIPIDEYNISAEGLKYYDLVEGKGPAAERGATVKVHFDCVYHGITAVSSRESKLLAGNRVIAQPYEFRVGSQPGKERKRDFVTNANGLYSAQAAPKPPPAMYTITEGMKVGGRGLSKGSITPTFMVTSTVLLRFSFHKFSKSFVCPTLHTRKIARSGCITWHLGSGFEWSQSTCGPAPDYLLGDHKSHACFICCQKSLAENCNCASTTWLWREGAE